MTNEELFGLVFFLVVMPITIAVCLWLNARWDSEIERGYDELEAAKARLENLRRRVREKRQEVAMLAEIEAARSTDSKLIN